MRIDGLDERPKPIVEEIGTFKLKDKVGRNAVKIDFSKVTRPLSEAKSMYIEKVHGQNNKIKVIVHWKPTKSLTLKEAGAKVDKILKKE